MRRLACVCLAMSLSRPGAALFKEEAGIVDWCANAALAGARPVDPLSAARGSATWPRGKGVPTGIALRGHT